MKKRYLSVLFSCVLLAATSYAHAGNSAGMATFTLGDGYYRFDSKRHIDNTGVPYGELAYNFTDHWALDGLLGFFTTDSRLPIDDGRQVTGTLFTIDAVYRFSPIYCNIEPYIMAGPGLLSMNPNGYDANTEGNVNAAVGAQYFISKSIAFKLEARDIYTVVGAKNDVFVNGGVSFLF